MYSEAHAGGLGRKANAIQFAERVLAYRNHFGYVSSDKGQGFLRNHLGLVKGNGASSQLGSDAFTAARQGNPIRQKCNRL